jgi:TatD DNase family protein
MIDIGLNLFNPQFDADRDEVVTRAKQAGVQGCVLTGTSIDNIPKVLAYASTYSEFFSATVGIHPHASQRTLAYEHKTVIFDTLARCMESKVCVAIGETGLDYQHEYSPRFEQQDVFIWHLQQSRLLDKPLFLHERGAHTDFLGLIQSVGLSTRPGVVHCFTGTRQEAKAYLDLGLHLGITGWVTDIRRNETLLDALKYIPKDRVLVETDAPFLTPRTVPGKPKRNEPQYLPRVIDALADLWAMPVEDVRQLTQTTTEVLFRRRWTHGHV